jgi:hypothetical protein
MALPRLLTSVAERLNPIVVKELRQAVQNRLVVGILILYLMIDLLIVGVVLLLRNEEYVNYQLGNDVFLTLFSILLFTCLGFVPLYAAVRLTVERNSGDADLMFITTLSPGAIIRGKFLSALALTLLIFSACMPFIVLTYLLRGIDLPTIFLFLGLGLCLCAGANMLGVFTGAFQGPLFFRGVLGIGLLGALGMGFSGVMSLIFEMQRFGGGISWTSDTFWSGLGTVMLVMLLGIGLLYVFAVAVISPRLSNRMMVPRLYVAGVWALSGLVAGGWCVQDDSLEPLIPWSVLNILMFCVLLFIVLGERDAWTARVQKAIPRNALPRFFTFILYSGSAGGILWYSLLTAITLLIVCALFEFLVPNASTREYRDLTDMCYTMGMTYGYMLCYCLSTIFIRDLFFKRTPTVVLPLSAVIFVGFFGIIAPFLLATFISARHDDWSAWWQLFSPICLMDRPGPSSRNLYDPVAPFVVVGWLMISGVLTFRWFLAQWRKFVPYKTEQIEMPVAVALAEPPPVG